MKKIVLTLAAFALAFSGITASTASASSVTPVTAAGQLQITHVGTDAMGTDSFRNRNREFVTFKNNAGVPLDVAGVLVEDSWAHSKTVNGDSHTCNTYKITDLPGSDTTLLGVGETITVFNGSRWGGDYKAGTEYRLYAKSDVDCGTAGQFYNNNNDTAYVTLTNGTVIAKWSWDWNGGYHFTAA